MSATLEEVLREARKLAPGERSEPAEMPLEGVRPTVSSREPLY